MQPANSGPKATPAAITADAELADRLGFDSLQVTDHVVVPLEIASPYPYNATGRFAASPDIDYYEPISLIGYLAGRTQRIRLGTSVLIAGYRNPVVTARQLASLDQLSGGRIVIGLGAGWMAEEFVALQSPPFEARGTITDEVIQVFRAIWRDQPASFEGKYFRFPPLGAMPKPAQPGGIPIIVGGNSRPAIRRAARLGDGWQPFKLPPDELRPCLAYLREQVERAGRDLAGFTTSLRLGLRLGTRPLERRAGEEEEWKTLVGTPDQVLASLTTYARLGVTEAVFDFRSCSPEETRETLQLAAEGILSHAAGL
ncbi:MAG: LLM class F420-dependent oxidoreductase [Dehalococcoidia bacterium]